MAAAVEETEEAAVLDTAESSRHRNVVVQKPSTSTAPLDHVTRVSFPDHHNSAALAAALSSQSSNPGLDNWYPASHAGTGLRGGECDGSSCTGGAAADAAAWLAAASSGCKKSHHDGDSTSLPALSSGGSCGPVPRAAHDTSSLPSVTASQQGGDEEREDAGSRLTDEGGRASVSSVGIFALAAQVGDAAVSNGSTIPAFQGNASATDHDSSLANHNGRSAATVFQRRRLSCSSGDSPSRSGGSRGEANQRCHFAARRTRHGPERGVVAGEASRESRTLGASLATEPVVSGGSASCLPPRTADMAAQSAALPPTSSWSPSPVPQSTQLPRPLPSDPYGSGASSSPSRMNSPRLHKQHASTFGEVSILAEALAHGRARSPVGGLPASSSLAPGLGSPDETSRVQDEADKAAADAAGNALTKSADHDD